MKSAVTIPTFFSLPVQHAGPIAIYLHTGTTPVPFTIVLVNLDELEAALQASDRRLQTLSFLSRKESELFRTFKYVKRQKEWLGGRLAAKHAVSNLMGIGSTSEAMQQFSVLPAGSGAPMIVDSSFPDNALPAISISHSDRFGVAMAAQGETCGIDIQKITEKTQRVADRFCTGDERKLLDKNVPFLNTGERLTLLWSAKEAVKKAMLHDQPAIFKGVTLLSLITDQHSTLHLRFPGGGATPAVVTAVMLEDCFLAHTVMKNLEPFNA
jgi:4'-phosphopantetheinyl transferase EntD